MPNSNLSHNWNADRFLDFLNHLWITPVWAIGTGRTPTAEDVAAMHGAIRAKLRAMIGEEADRVRLLYGGSVTPDNARELLHVADVDGALVGGASLTAAKFAPIIAAAE